MPTVSLGWVLWSYFTMFVNASAPMMKRLSLELGGKNAAIVFGDARLDKAIPTLLRASFLNQVITYFWSFQISIRGTKLRWIVYSANFILSNLRYFYEVGTVRYEGSGHRKPICHVFEFFSNNLKNKNWRLQQDSNLDHWSRRQACWPLDQHHGTPTVMCSKKSENTYHSWYLVWLVWIK